jgi:hypothetical protein
VVGVEADEPCPLPEDPVLMAACAAVRDGGHWGVLILKPAASMAAIGLMSFGRHVGDGVVAFFPAATFPSESHAARACIEAARAIRAGARTAKQSAADSIRRRW